jgi:ArsR family transcriptional regulator
MGRQLVVAPAICCAPGAEPLPTADREALAARFAALADPTRLGIVNRLASAGELCVCVLTPEFDVSQPTMSHHLKVLREAGLVESERRGRWAYYRVRSEALQQLARTLGA